MVQLEADKDCIHPTPDSTFSSLLHGEDYLIASPPPQQPVTMCWLQAEYFSFCYCLVGRTRLCAKAMGLDMNPPPLLDNYEPGVSLSATAHACKGVDTSGLIYHNNCERYPNRCCDRHNKDVEGSKSNIPLDSSTAYLIFRGRGVEPDAYIHPADAEKRMSTKNYEKVTAEVVERINKQLDGEFGVESEERKRYRP
ncbi:hypothetical protein B0T20DRAFT_503041, partial [Sordaria brevicollis]